MVVAAVVVIVGVVLLLLRETRGHGAKRASRGQAVVVGRQLSSSSSGDRLSRLCPVGQACAVPCVRPVRRCVSSLVWAAGCWSWFTRLGGGGKRDGALEERGTRHEAQGGERVGSVVPPSG